MTLSTAILTERRSRANYLPMCPVCSLRVGLPDQILAGPTHREFRGAFKLDGCCKYSTPPENYFDSEAEAASWWRQARLLEVGPLGDEFRRRRTLHRLFDAGLEPIELKDL